MIGVFVEWNPGRKNSPGYIIDGNGCHVWIGERTNDGYARANRGGRRVMVYRERYEREVGPIPPGHQLDHYVCNNGAGGCCNPRHCRPATPRENSLRSDNAAARAAAQTHCKHGHELTTDNLLPDALRRGKRACRRCRNALILRKYHAQMAAGTHPRQRRRSP